MIREPEIKFMDKPNQESTPEIQHSSAPDTPDQNNKKIAILVCTYNGARFLKEQLDSFIEQSHQNWAIYVSDDGSSDETLDILKDYQLRLGSERLVILQGPRKGFARNFLSLVKNPSIIADYFCFSDQDDIWFKNKLSRSLDLLPEEGNAPALYCSRTALVNSSLEPIGYSPLFLRTPCFENALVQSIAGANTMLINNAARALLLRVADDAPVVAHDWLTYLLVTGCGGRVIYDPTPSLHYRQHEGNLIGANADLKNQILRLRKMFTGRFSQWSTQNLSILHTVRDRLTDRNRQVLELFETARRSSLPGRLYRMRKSGVHRQTLKGNISLIVATLMNKI